MRTLLLVAALMIVISLSGCVSVALHREAKFRLPKCNTGDTYSFDKQKCVPELDLSDKPMGNHYPACDWQVTMPCEEVTR